MKIEPKDVVGAYRALRSVIETSSVHAKEAVLVFFIQRSAVFCFDAGLIEVEQHKSYLEIFYRMVGSLDRDVSENLSNITKSSAENAGTDGDETLDVGYFSILSYSFTFLLSRQNDYVNYASDRYLGSIESYLIDRDGSELDNEITNIELLTEAVAVLEVRRDSDGLSLLGAWAVSASVGQRLPDFSL